MTMNIGPQRLNNLAARFSYQFPRGYRGVCMIRIGWLCIVERLCFGVHAAVDTEARDRFSWTYVGTSEQGLGVRFPSCIRSSAKTFWKNVSGSAWLRRMSVLSITSSASSKGPIASQGGRAKCAAAV